MKREDEAVLKEVRQGKVGNVTFIRYSLHATKKPIEKIIQHIKETFTWMSAISEQQDLQDIYASANREKTVWLITCQFTNKMVANLFFDFSTDKSAYIKQTEIAGTSGLYVFDSSVEAAFQSNFLTSDPIEPEARTCPWAEKWWTGAEESIKTGDVFLIEKGRTL